MHLLKLREQIILDSESLLFFVRCSDLSQLHLCLSVPPRICHLFFFLLTSLTCFRKETMQSGRAATPHCSSFQHTLPSSSSSSSPDSRGRMFPADGAVLKQMAAQNSQPMLSFFLQKKVINMGCEGS